MQALRNHGTIFCASFHITFSPLSFFPEYTSCSVISLSASILCNSICSKSYLSLISLWRLPQWNGRFSWATMPSFSVYFPLVGFLPFSNFRSTILHVYLAPPPFQYQNWVKELSSFSKVNKWDLIKLTRNVSYRQNEKTIYGMEENICKWCNQ